jgi:general secretion pathway protein A
VTWLPAPLFQRARPVFVRHEMHHDGADETLCPALPRASAPDRTYTYGDKPAPSFPSAARDPRRRSPKDGLMSGSDYFAQHFGLTERPFTLLPDPEFLYWSPAHKRAFSVLEYGVLTRAPITVITGEVGAGKTTLLQELLKNFDDTTVVGLISNAQGGRGELLQWVLNALDVPFEHNAAYVAMFQTLQDFVIAQYAEGNHVVLVIDEAQNLSMEGLEELRMLTNINSNKDELLQLILVGQPELLDMIRRPELRQFAQRVSASFHISALDIESTRAYIQHRLRHAAGSGEEFTDAAIELIWVHTHGVPRLINKLADFAMVYAITADKTQVDEETVREVLNDNIFIETTDTGREAAE